MALCGFCGHKSKDALEQVGYVHITQNFILEPHFGRLRSCGLLSFCVIFKIRLTETLWVVGGNLPERYFYCVKPRVCNGCIMRVPGGI